MRIIVTMVSLILNFEINLKKSRRLLADLVYYSSMLYVKVKTNEQQEYLCCTSLKAFTTFH